MTHNFNVFLDFRRPYLLLNAKASKVLNKLSEYLMFMAPGKDLALLVWTLSYYVYLKKTFIFIQTLNTDSDHVHNSY